jgi:hypothetical protein
MNGYLIRFECPKLQRISKNAYQFNKITKIKPKAHGI